MNARIFCIQIQTYFKIILCAILDETFLQNVLEGIGLLVKRGKNHVSWNENPPETAAQVVAEDMAKSNTGENSDTDAGVDASSASKVSRKRKSPKNSEEYEDMKKKIGRAHV